jgi:hypothetical protein
VNDAFSGFNDNYFLGIADAYKKFQTPLFQEQAAEARRKLPMSVPHTASSAYQRKTGQLETDILRGETDLQSKAIDESNRRRGEIDYERTNLLNLATGGATAETVAQQAAQKAQQFAAPPEFSPIADLFQKYTADAANYALAGQSRGSPRAQAVTPLSFGHSPGRSFRTVGA